MTLESRMEGKTLVVTPGRKFTAQEGCEALSGLVHQALDAGAVTVLLHLAGVELLDSLGVGQIVAAHTSCQGRGARLTLLAPSARVLLVLRMASLHLVLDIEEGQGGA